jgi:hypothetical protein
MMLKLAGSSLSMECSSPIIFLCSDLSPAKLVYILKIMLKILPSLTRNLLSLFSSSKSLSNCWSPLKYYWYPR